MGIIITLLAVILLFFIILLTASHLEFPKDPWCKIDTMDITDGNPKLPLKCYGNDPCNRDANICRHIIGNSTQSQYIAREHNCEWNQTNATWSVNFTKADGSSFWC